MYYCLWNKSANWLNALTLLATTTLFLNVAQAAEFTTTVTQPGSDPDGFNKAIWQPGGVTPTSGLPGNTNIYTVTGGLIRSPDQTGQLRSYAKFNGDILVLARSGASSYRMKPGNPGVIEIPILILTNNAWLDMGNNGTVYMTGQKIIVADGAQIIRNAANRAIVIETPMEGIGTVTVDQQNTVVNVPCPNFKGGWIVANTESHLRGMVDYALGTGPIVVGDNAAARLDLAYDHVCASSLTLNGSAKLYLYGDHVFNAVTLGGTTLSPGTYSYAQLLAGFPDNILPYGKGSIRVFGTTAAPEIILDLANQTALPGAKAMFTVKAAGATTFAWSTNGVLDASTTGPIYISPSAAVSQNGMTVQCQVGNANGSATTATATLTVPSGPAVVSAANYGSLNNLLVAFSKAVDPATATVAGNYTLNNGVTVSQAVMAGTDKVILTTTPMFFLTSYTLTVSGVTDASANPIVAPGTASFTARANRGYIQTDFQSGLPTEYQNALYGNAYIKPVGNQNYVLKLQESVNNSSGSWVIGDLNLGAEKVNSFNAKMKLWVGGGTYPPSVNINFNFAPDLPDNAPIDGGGQWGAGSGLSVVINVINMGSTANRAAYLKYHNINYAYLDVPDDVVLTYPSNNVWEVNLDANGKVTVKLGTTTIFNQVQVPWVPATGRFGIYARSVYGPANFWVDDVTIDTFHPYSASENGPLAIVTQPQSVTVEEGAVTTFSVAASGGAPIIYQWKSNGVAIAGATNAIYSPPTKPLATMDGTVYSVDLCNPFGSISSDSAILTVHPDVTPPTVTGIASFGLNTVVITFTEPMEPATTQNPANYFITPATPVQSAVLDSSLTKLTLTTSPQNQNTTCNVVVAGLRDNSPSHNPLATVILYYTNQALLPGLVKWERFNGTDNLMASLYALPKFINNSPDEVRWITALSDQGFNPGNWNNYGTRYTTWFMPSATGNYVFYSASDDYSEVWLSPDANPADKVLIASVTGWTSRKSYVGGAGTGGAHSSPVTLQANQLYYLETLHTQGTGGDNLDVAVGFNGSVPANGSPALGQAGNNFGNLFYLAPGGDTMAPYMEMVSSLDGYKVGVRFNEPVLPFTAVNVANYSVLPMPITDLALASVTRPGDTVVGFPDIVGGSTAWPVEENPNNAIDGVLRTKYLNFGKVNTGFIVALSGGAQSLSAVRVTSANDAPERDPASITLEGSADGVTFAPLFAANLGAFPARGSQQTVSLPAPSAAFSHYRVTFPTISNETTAVAMQVAEVELLGVPTATQVLAAEMQNDQTVVLTLSKPVKGEFSLASSGIVDLSGNISASAAVTGNCQVWRFMDSSMMVGGNTNDPKLPGDIDWSASDTNSLVVTVGGSDIWNNQDGYNFIYREVTNDFSISVRVESLEIANRWGKAGLMVRESLSAGSRNHNIVTDPRGDQVAPDGSGLGANNIEVNCRPVENQISSSWPGGGFVHFSNPLPYPNVWLRLDRSNSLLTAYFSTDGQNWQVYGRDMDTYPPNVFVGLATCAHKNTRSTRAVYSNLHLKLLEATPSSGDMVTLFGVALDGYVSGATVFYDTNFNGVRDVGEPFTATDERGQFTLAVLKTFDEDGNGKLDPYEGHLVMQGGVDLATGLPIKTDLTAPANSAVITPLTTLLDVMVAENTGLSLETAQGQLKAAIGLLPDSSVDLTKYNPYVGVANNDPEAVTILISSAQVQDTLVQMVALMGGENSSQASEVASNTLCAMAAQVAQVEPGRSFNLSESSQVQTLMNQVANDQGKPMDMDLLAGATAIIAEGNALKDQVAQGSTDAVGAAQSISQVQQVSQGIVADQLEQAGAGTRSIEEVLAATTGQTLADKVNLASPGDPFATEMRVGAFAFSRDTFSVLESGQAIEPITIVRTDGNQGVVRLKVRITGAQSGTFSQNELEVVFASGELIRTVDLSGILVDDNLEEGDELATLGLALAEGNPSEAKIGVQTSASLTIVDNDRPPSITTQPSSQIVAVNSKVVFSVEAGGSYPLQYQWHKDGTALANNARITGCSTPSLTITGAQLEDAGAYSVVVRNMAGNVASDNANLTFENNPPVAPDLTYTRASGLSLKIRIADALAQCQDSDGDAITLQSVGAGSQGAVISTTATHILYNPSTGNNNNDTFNYTVCDARGATATGAISMQVVKPGGLARSLTVVNGTVTVNFAGIPSFSYDILRATSLTGPWTLLSTQTAPANGIFNYTDPTPPPGGAFYRLQQR